MFPVILTDNGGKAPEATDDEIFVYEDEGFSAKNLDRPQFRAMMTETKKLLSIVLERVHINRNVRILKRIFRRTRRKFADVLYVLQEFSTKLCEKIRQKTGVER